LQRHIVKYTIGLYDGVVFPNWIEARHARGLLYSLSAIAFGVAFSAYAACWKTYITVIVVSGRAPAVGVSVLAQLFAVATCSMRVGY